MHAILLGIYPGGNASDSLAVQFHVDDDYCGNLAEDVASITRDYLARTGQSFDDGMTLTDVDEMLMLDPDYVSELAASGIRPASEIYYLQSFEIDEVDFS